MARHPSERTHCEIFVRCPVQAFSAPEAEHTLQNIRIREGLESGTRSIAKNQYSLFGFGFGVA